MISCVVVQQQLRLFREGLGQLLATEDDLDVACAVRTPEELVAMCHEHLPQVVVLEGDADKWDPNHLTAGLCRTFPNLRVIGLTTEAPTADEVASARRSGMCALVGRAGGVSGILGAIRHGQRPPKSVRTPPLAVIAASTKANPNRLTARELSVLTLIGAGCTSRDTSERLSISAKTVENHKQRIFRKLGVQNQAHAVSIAIERGLIRPDRMIDAATAG